MIEGSGERELTFSAISLKPGFEERRASAAGTRLGLNS